MRARLQGPFLRICMHHREGSVYTCWELCRRPAASGLGRAPLACHLQEQSLETGALLSGFDPSSETVLLTTPLAPNC